MFRLQVLLLLYLFLFLWWYPPGVLVKVHVPDDGKPLNTTLPVDTLHVGCVIVPTVGAVGACRCCIDYNIA